MAEPTKRCGHCRKTKPVSEFGRASEQKDGLARTCLMCRREYTKDYYVRTKEKYKARTARYKKTSKYRKYLETTAKATARIRQLKRYGIDESVYSEMLAAQRNRCAICGAKYSQKNARSGKPCRLHVDHNHDTGEVRGLLCHWCNLRVGVIEDETFCERARLYLEGSAN